MTERLAEVVLCGLPLARLDTDGLLDHMFGALEQKRGGWVVTVNLDFLRMASESAELHAVYREADLRVADGMPVVWATRVLGSGVPAQIAGSSIIWPIGERANRSGRSVYLLGGSPGTADEAAAKLRERWPNLRVGASCPWVADPPKAEELDAMLEALRGFGADIVFVAFGTPKQEHVIRALRQRLPSAWMLGVGGTFNFVAGRLPRAPVWMQQSGLEWLHRLALEPRRLAGRYLLHDAPFALQMIARYAGARVRRVFDRRPNRGAAEAHEVRAAPSAPSPSEQTCTAPAEAERTPHETCCTPSGSADDTCCGRVPQPASSGRNRPS